MFIDTLFITGYMWKQPKCPSTDEWMKNVAYTIIMEYYPAIKKNECLAFEATWMYLEGIVFSKISQVMKDKYFMFHLYVESIK